MLLLIAAVGGVSVVDAVITWVGERLLREDERYSVVATGTTALSEGNKMPAVSPAGLMVTVSLSEDRRESDGLVVTEALSKDARGSVGLGTTCKILCFLKK